MHSTVEVLNRILARETSALLPYLKYAGPWAGVEEAPAQATVLQMVADHDEACKKLADLVVKRHAIAATPIFPHEFSSVHFIALDHLLPWLASFQRWLIERLEADFQELREEEGITAVSSVLELKRRQLTTLEKLAEEYAGVKAVSTRK